MKLAFYTSFYGSDRNTSYAIPALPSLKYKCYFYTNNNSIVEKLNGTNWIPIYDNKPITDDPIESCIAAKHVKIMPHEYNELKDYDYLCFLDSKVAHVNELFVENFIYKYFVEKDYALLLRKHWFIGGNVWDEYNESMFQYRYNIESEKYKKYINNQVQNGLSTITDNHCACGFLIRNMKHKNMLEINTTWHRHIQECGIQDQISFFFVKQLFNDIIHPFSEIPYL